MQVLVDIPENVADVFLENPDIGRIELQKHGVSNPLSRIYAWVYKNGRVVDTLFHPEENKIRSVYNENGVAVEVNSLTIATLDDAIKVAKVDLDKWEVDRHTINSWGVTLKTDDGPVYRTNYHIKIWLKSIVPNPIQLALENLIETIPTFPFDRVPRFTKPSGIAGEVWPIDAHFGKLSWALETGRQDYDLKIATKGYIEGVEKTLSFLSLFEPEKIFFGVGQDLMHIENYSAITPKGGNVLDVDSRYPKIYDAAFKTVTKCILKARDLAPTEIIWIPGNHDLHASRSLCHALQQYFRNDEYVTVDIGPEQRKARLWGKLLVGWTHEIVSKHHSWANELAQNWPKLWGKSWFREWHHGHKHKKNEVKTYPVMTQGGVLMRQLTALSPIDAWHYEHLFTDAVPGTESFVWSKKHGIIDNHIEWTDP
jgi:hypothetical protein